MHSHEACEGTNYLYFWDHVSFEAHSLYPDQTTVENRGLLLLHYAIHTPNMPHDTDYSYPIRILAVFK